MKNKRILVTGAGGFIGPHLARTLLEDGNFVRAVDIKWDDYVKDKFCNEKLTLDLRSQDNCLREKSLMSLHMISSLAFVISGIMSVQDHDLFTFEQSNNAEVHLYGNEKAEEPISRYLYGKFTEHLGRNIYGGMWAQILQNPGFEGWHFWGSKPEDIRRRARHYAERLGIPDIMESYDQGIAPWWLAYGSGDVKYDLDTDSFNSELAQKITVNSLESQQAGIRQFIFLSGS